MYNNNNLNQQFVGFQAAPNVNQFGQPITQGPIGINGAPMKLNATNPLGANRINEMLKNGKGAPNLQITEEDYDKAICTHRDTTGSSRVVQMGDGKVRCEICGAEFALTDSASIEDIKIATENMHNVMNTAKVMWLDVPDQVAVEMFQVLAVIDKVPQLYEIATSRLQKYQDVNPMMQNQYPVNGFNMLGQMIGPNMGFGGFGQPQQMMPQCDQFGNPINAGQMQTGMYNPAQQFAMNPTAMATVGGGLNYAQPNPQMTGYVTNQVTLPGGQMYGANGQQQYNNGMQQQQQFNGQQQYQNQGQQQVQQQQQAQQQQQKPATSDNKSDVSVSAQMHP